MLDNFSNTAGIPVINDISEKSPQEQLYEMHNYLYQLQEWLDWKLRHLEAEDFTDDTRKKIGTAEDTGWKKITTFNANFQAYSASTQPVQYRKIGSIVFLQGACKPTASLPARDENNNVILYPMFQLPAGFRPQKQVNALCQGSGTTTWLLHIQTNGRVNFTRSRNESGYRTAAATDWLPFNVSFPVG